MGKVTILIAALALAGCATAQGSFCEMSKPVRLTNEQIDQLTDDQARQLLAHNRKGQSLCGWRP